MKQAFYDDRKGRAVIDERERVVRAAQEARRAAGELPEPSTRGGPAGRGRGGCVRRDRIVLAVLVVLVDMEMGTEMGTGR